MHAVTDIFSPVLIRHLPICHSILTTSIPLPVLVVKLKTESSLEPENPVQPVTIIVFRISDGSSALSSAMVALLADLSALSLPLTMNIKVTYYAL